MLKIGLIREGKRPIDRRVPLTPQQAATFNSQYQQATISVQSSYIRCFTDEEYTSEGLVVQEEMQDCDVLMGIKEVPVQELVPGKTYLFFSHTIKKQPYNRQLLQEILNRNIRLIDYERITDEEGNRLVAFGKWAGIVGAYNAIWTWGRRYNSFDLRRAFKCYDYQDLKTEFKKVQLPPIRIVVTGGGRVAKGAIEVLEGMGIKRVSPEELLQDTFTEAVFAQVNSRHYHYRRNGGGFDQEEFYQHPELYDSSFAQFYRNADMLIAAAYWHPAAPVLFSPAEAASADFRIKIIADITCDIDGSIPSTKKASNVTEPIYDYVPGSDSITTPLADQKNITVMAIDNLPCELPRDASESFGNALMQHVMPHFTGGDRQGILARATITEGGKLTPAYAYLQDYVDGKE
ncbi:NAD(P)-dependent oxidoreductase [Cesiribacter sp. SM1]|uniref:NAD(P)-dependent oxidoreductase n=1 Tax=Cesiribacter sp. SM1 TaxID=2861196 RepID=UPI001CD648B2|nr:NAD(P)-dependent oxidoreductase [Cesiribacter sp. SM1]